MKASLSVSRVALALCALLSVPAIAASVQAAATPLQIKVLSNRADLISAGDALVEIVLAPGVLPSAVQVDVDGRDVTRAFALRSNGRFMGIVEGLTVGANVLTARAKGAATARITLTNHSRSGPVFAGPQVQPWFCTTDANGLGMEALRFAVDDAGIAMSDIDGLIVSRIPSYERFSERKQSSRTSH